MRKYRPVPFLCLAALLTLCAASANSAPAATNESGQAVQPRLQSLLRVTGSWNLALQTAPAAAKADDPLPDGKGKDLTKKVCSGCHALSVISDKRHPADEWDSIMERMISKGLEASDDDLDTIRNYLVTNLGTAPDGSTGTPPASPPPQ